MFESSLFPNCVKLFLISAWSQKLVFSTFVNCPAHHLFIICFSFGVCCVFTISSATGGTVSQNSTYLQNPGYPSALTSTSAISYTINKQSSGTIFNSVVFLRLNLEFGYKHNFTILDDNTLWYFYFTFWLRCSFYWKPNKKSYFSSLWYFYFNFSTFHWGFGKSDPS